MTHRKKEKWMNSLVCLDLLKQVLDYRQYYLDLSAAEWLPEYNFTDYYG
jgi:hypothetical protein